MIYTPKVLCLTFGVCYVEKVCKTIKYMHMLEDGYKHKLCPKKIRNRWLSPNFNVGIVAGYKFLVIKKKVSVKAGLSLRMQAIKDFEKRFIFVRNE